MYAVYHGPDGIKAIAQSVHRKTSRLADGLEEAGFSVEPEVFFDTITVEVGHLQTVFMEAAVARGVNLRKVGDSHVGISLDEQTRPETIEAVITGPFFGRHQTPKCPGQVRVRHDLTDIGQVSVRQIDFG